MTASNLKYITAQHTSITIPKEKKIVQPPSQRPADDKFVFGTTLCLFLYTKCISHCSKTNNENGHLYLRGKHREDYHYRT